MESSRETNLNRRRMSVHEPRPTPFGIAFVRRCSACDGLWPCRDVLLARNQAASALHIRGERCLGCATNEHAGSGWKCTGCYGHWPCATAQALGVTA